MPTLSDAKAEKAIVPPTADPSAGPVTTTLGDVVSAALLTVRVMPLEVAAFPAKSVTLADKTWEPLATVWVFHVREYGLVKIGDPSGIPSRRNWTFPTITLSTAVAEIVVVPETAPSVLGLGKDAVGTVLSSVP